MKKISREKALNAIKLGISLYVNDEDYDKLNKIVLNRSAIAPFLGQERNKEKN